MGPLGRAAPGPSCRPRHIATSTCGILLALDGAEGDITVGVLNNIAESRAIRKDESLTVEAKAYIDSYKKKDNKQWYDIQRAMDLFLEATGHIRLFFTARQPAAAPCCRIMNTEIRMQKVAKWFHHPGLTPP
jgi:hypothetical protein